MAENENGQRRDSDRPRSNGGDRKPYGGRSGGRSYGKGNGGSGYRGGKPYRKREDGEGGERSEFRGEKRYDKRDGDRRPYSKGGNGGSRDGRPYGNRENGDRKPYKKNFGGDKRYDKRDGGRKPYSEGGRDGSRGDKRYEGGERSEFRGEKRYDRRDDGERRPYKKEYDRKPRRDGEEGGYRDGDRKPYSKGGRDGFRGKRRDEGGYRKRDDAPRSDAESGEEYVDNRTRKFGKRRDGQRADWVSESEGKGSRGGKREKKRYDMVTRRDLVQIATTDASEDFVWAGNGQHRTDSEFYVNVGDPVVHATYGEGLVCKVISGKVQVEFADGKRWYAHPLAMSKGILLKPGMEPPAPAEDGLEDLGGFDDELAAALFAEAAPADDGAYGASDDGEAESEAAADAREDGDAAEDGLVEPLEATAPEKAADVEDLFADVMLLTGDDLEAGAGEAE